MMLEELKFALLSISGNNETHLDFWNFWESNTSIQFVYMKITVEGYEDRILVCYDYDPGKVLGAQKLNYLNRENTLKTFTNVPSAIAYMKYLSIATWDIKFELYYYFLFKIKELKLEYEGMSFAITGLERQFIRCALGGLKLNGLVIGFNLLIVFSSDGASELRFYPEDPIWEEGKVCPETQIDKIIESFILYSTYRYDEIPLKEV
jgi:hypothetical protein